MYTNADQLTTNKMAELKRMIENSRPQILAICEVNPKNSKGRCKQDYHISGYTFYSVNIESDTRRGIAIYVQNNLANSVRNIEVSVEFQEVCLLEIKLRGGDTMIFGCFYRSPSYSNTSDDNNMKLNALLRNLGKKHYSHQCFVGDFNYKDINWKHMTTLHNEESKEFKFIETIHECFLYQHVTEATRKRGNDNPSLIDLVLSDELMQVSNIEYHAPLGKSDHSVITFDFHCYLDYSKTTKRHNYRKGDYPAMKNELEQWKAQFLQESTCSVNNMWESFKTKIHHLRDQFIPMKVSGNQKWRQEGKVPINKAVQSAIKAKRKLHRQWIKAPNIPESETIRKK